MVTYICDKCCKIFDHKTNYNYHINRKYSCKSDKEDENNIVIKQQLPTAKQQLPTAKQQLPTAKEQILTTKNIELIDNKIINDKQCQYCHKVFTRHYT